MLAQRFLGSNLKLHVQALRGVNRNINTLLCSSAGAVLAELPGRQQRTSYESFLCSADELSEQLYIMTRVREILFPIMVESQLVSTYPYTTLGNVSVPRSCIWFIERKLKR